MDQKRRLFQIYLDTDKGNMNLQIVAWDEREAFDLVIKANEAYGYYYFVHGYKIEVVQTDNKMKKQLRDSSIVEISI